MTPVPNMRKHAVGSTENIGLDLRPAYRYPGRNPRGCCSVLGKQVRRIPPFVRIVGKHSEGH